MSPDESSRNVRKATTRLICFGPFQLDQENHRLFKRGIKVRLNQKSCELLGLLIDRACQIVRYEAIYSALWDEPSAYWLALVKQTACSLKYALRDLDAPAHYVEPIKGQGYVFVAEIEGSQTNQHRFIRGNAEQ